MLAERREEALALEGGWGDAEEIAQQTGVETRIVLAFIEHHRDKLGVRFNRSRRLSKTQAGTATRRITEHFSPGFIDWAVQSLLVAKARYEASQSSSEL